MIPATYHPTWPLAAMPPLAPHANLGVWKLLRSEKATGGTLHVSSRPEEGTSLVVELPIDAGQPRDAT